MEELPALYRELGVNYDDRVIKSVAEEVIKSIVADYYAEQLITMRDVVAERVSANMREKAALYNIEFQDVSLVDIQFDAEFMQSVEYARAHAHMRERERGRETTEHFEALDHLLGVISERARGS